MPTRKTTSSKTTKKTTAPKRASAKATTKKRAAAKTKAPAKRKKATSTVGEKEVTIDRRRAERREEELAAAEPQLERRKKVARRRQIDPTTCERDYSDQEVEFMNALDDYKRKSGRMFPTCSEVLEVIRDLGYVQLSPAELAARNAMNEGAEPDGERTSYDDADLETADLEAELVS